MSKKLQCQQCGKAEYNEDLYNYDGEILCRYCIVARVCESSTPCEYVGTCNDKTFLNKADQIDQLKQQLEEYKNKENTSAVNSWDEMLKNCENCGLNECIGCEYTQTCVQNIKQQLAEKDKEIEKLKQQYTILENENGKLTTELIMDKYKKAKKEVSFGTQLAIQELEKVKNFVDGRTYCASYIKKRIKELKGEKDVED